MSLQDKWRRLRFWLLWPALFVYMRNSRRVRVVIVDGNKILLVQSRSNIWYDNDPWMLPGGGLHWFEKPAAGAIREIREELGIELKHSDLRPLWRGRIGGYGLRYRGYFMLVHVSQKTPLTLQTSEVAAAKWFTLNSAQSANLKVEARRALALLAGKS